jgi:hypothetical protein
MAPGQQKKYSEEAIEQAVRAVEDNRLSFRQASEDLRVPHTTIRGRVRRLPGPNMGQPTVLTSTEEEMLCDYIKLLAKWGSCFLVKISGISLEHTWIKKIIRQ